MLNERLAKWLTITLAAALLAACLVAFWFALEWSLPVWPKEEE